MTKLQIEKFQILYKQEFGKDISHQEALDNALKLIEMVRQIYKPIKKSEHGKFIKSNN